MSRKLNQKLIKKCIKNCNTHPDLIIRTYWCFMQSVMVYYFLNCIGKLLSKSKSSKYPIISKTKFLKVLKQSYLWMSYFLFSTINVVFQYHINKSITWCFNVNTNSCLCKTYALLNRCVPKIRYKQSFNIYLFFAKFALTPMSNPLIYL